MQKLFELESFLPYRVNVTAARLSQMLSEKCLAKYDINIAEWRVLAHLSQTSKLSVKDIHLAGNMNRPKVTRAAQTLELKGLVKKVTHKDDKRLVELSLSKKGVAFIEKVKPEIYFFEKKALQFFESDDYDRLGDLLKKIEQGLKTI